LDTCTELQGRTFDTVVAADVVEHLNNFGLFLKGVAPYLSRNGTLVITTPHAFAAKRMLAMLLTGREHVHPDHTAYYSVSTMSRILDRHSYNPSHWAMFQWKNPTAKNKLANWAVKPFLRVTGGRLCDGLLVVASRSQ
jgi:2-polyprenyl-3-methyl-5-hydroxy-6-metoxy-1,4-benzoquinol methylase